MGSSSLSEDYRLCLERELQRGRAGVCGDPSLRAVLWQILVEDFDLHGVLQDDALALLTDGLWGRADLAPALRSLARAFELLELAAVHLYLLPWRKEFTTIKEEEPPPLPPRGSPAMYRAPLDLYRDLQEDEGSEEASLYGGPSPGPDSPPSELAYRPPLWEQSAKLWGSGGRAWEPPAEAEVPQQASSPPYEASEEELEPEPSAFSFLSLRRELLSRPGDAAAPRAPGSPGWASPQHVHGPNPETPGYQAHSCLASGALPTLCCDTCRQLHAAHCAALPVCHQGHVQHTLLSDTQRRLWLQRAQVDSLLYDSPGARP
nr:PREDICTED: spermatogenesis-associated protein 2-like protein [Equus przewalskii]